MKRPVSRGPLYDLHDSPLRLKCMHQAVDIATRERALKADGAARAMIGAAAARSPSSLLLDQPEADEDVTGQNRAGVAVGAPAKAR